MHLKNHKIRKQVLFFIGFFGLCVLFYFLYSARNITVSYYRTEANVADKIRIVQLTDLHNTEFGKSNDKLVALVEKQHPDIIVMTGDMLNAYEPKLEIVSQLIEAMTSIAPVYYGYGNHESAWERAYNTDLSPILQQNGAIVVNNSYVDVDINNVAVRIGGYMGYYHFPNMLTNDEEQKSAELAFCQDFEQTSRFKILLNHIPTAWVDWRYYNEFPVDLVFSGHYHGGQWVLPIIGPVYAPYVGFNPPYVKGIFEGKTTTCIFSAGLGNEHWWLPRINNPAEIVVVDIVPQT